MARGSVKHRVTVLEGIIRGEMFLRVVKDRRLGRALNKDIKW